MTNEQIAGYALESELGRGAMGVVYQARRANDADQVALKIAHAEVAADLERLLLVDDEFRALASMEHKRIIPVYERGKHGDRPYIVMPLVDGSTLADPAYRERFYEPDKLLGLMSDLASGMEAMHRKQLVHCDLSPNNILISEEGEPCIIDFGGAWAPWLCKQTRRTCVAPSGYAPPEFGDPQPKATSDIYTFGAMCIELVHEARASWHAQGVHKRRGLRLLDDLEKVCEKAKQAKPEDRYPSGIELALELDILKRMGSLEPVSWTVSFVDWALGNRLLLAALAVLLLVASYMPWALLGIERAELDERTKAVAQLNQKVASIRAQLIGAEIDRITTLVRLIAARANVFDLVVEQRGLLQPSGALLAHDALRESELLKNIREELAEQVHFDSLFVLNSDCMHLARSPAYTAAQYRNMRFGWRDYCTGIQKEGLDRPGAAYVSRVYIYPVDPAPGEPTVHRFGIAATLNRPGEEPAILVGTLDSGNTFGKLDMPELEADGTYTSVVAWLDRARPDDNLPKAPIPFAQERLSKGGWTVDENESGKECIAAVQGDARHKSTSATATAAVPGTQHFVICQTTPLGPSHASQHPRTEYVRNYLYIPATAGLCVSGILVVLSSLRRLRKRG